MKRLVDETTDELARSLLQAGIEHHPPPGNKAQVIVALGAGGALGLFSTNAFAWLSTTAGKVTAVGVAVGVASAVWVAVPPAREARSDAAAVKTAALNAGESSDDATHSQPVVDSAGRAVASTAHLEATAAGTNGERTGDDRGAALELEASRSARAAVARAAVARAAVARAAVDAETADVAAPSERQASSARRERARKLARKSLTKNGVASKQSELRRDGPLSAVETPPAGGALDEQDALDTEVRLVDEMHSAARRNDRETLGRVVDHYRATFPDGQLKREVAEFAARFEHPIR
jgi:hypothetical protein